MVKYRRKGYASALSKSDIKEMFSKDKFNDPVMRKLCEKMEKGEFLTEKEKDVLGDYSWEKTKYLLRKNKDKIPDMTDEEIENAIESVRREIEEEEKNG